ncbi:MAG TPA: hypothetical protein VN376_03275 [Longilinea sp.]|nr:hypothetical protein [Longilinea sp.]
MSSRLSPHALMQISAYLDGQLSAREMSETAHKIQTDPQYRQAFEELKRTRLVLRNTPRRKPPRNYYLTPQMVKQRIRQPVMVRQFGFASAFAAIALVLILLGDFASNLSFGAMAPSAMMADQAASESVAAESAPLTESMPVTQETKPPEVIYWGTQTAPDTMAPAPDSALGGMGGGGGGDAAGTTGAAPLSTPSTAEESNRTGAVIPTATLQSLGNFTTSSDASNGNPILGIAPSDQQGEPLTQTLSVIEEDTSDRPSIDWLPIIEISLAVIMIVSAILSIAFRRRL